MSPVLKFLRFSAGESAEKDLEILDKAAEYAQNNEIPVEIVKSPDSIQSVLRNKNVADDQSIYVCFPFDGKIFETLKGKGYRIVGPQCLISCLLLEVPLPKQTYPICSVAMLNVVICCSSMKKDERVSIHNLVLIMGGQVTKDFTSAVTHLIAKEVGSKKYQVACTNNIPILSPSWVNDIWVKSKYEHIVASDKKVYEQHLVPIFKGCTICVTGMNYMLRENFKKLIEDNGGVYSGELNMKTCTHLLCEQSKGQKYEFARKWKLHCILPLWVSDCIKQGHWLDETPYKVEPDTDVTELSTSLMQKSKIQATFLETTNTLKTHNRQSVSSKAAEIAAKSLERSLSTNVTITEEATQHQNKLQFKTFRSRAIDLKSFRLPNSNENHYLDGCKIYLCNKKCTLFGCCRKIINDGGGIWFSDLSNPATHFVLWDNIENDVKTFLNEFEGHLPHVVSPLWLIDSCMAQSLQDEKSYSLLMQVENLDNQVTFNDVTFAAPNKPAENSSNKKSAAVANTLNPNLDEDQGDDLTLMNQYLSEQQHESTRLSQLEFEKLPAKAGLTTIQDCETATMDEDETVPLIFMDKKFVIRRCQDDLIDRMKEVIENYGGIVTHSEETCDHIVVPLSCQNIIQMHPKEATICWLEQSCEQELVLNPKSSFLFRPIHIPDGTRPLDGCCVSFSQFQGMERIHLIHLVDLLGGKGSEYFARNSSHKMDASTHLILMKPEGSKYEAAKKWGVPTVSKKWLIETAKKLTRQNETDFPVLEDNEETFVDNEELTEEVLRGAETATVDNDNPVANVELTEQRDTSLFEDNKEDIKTVNGYESAEAEFKKPHPTAKKTEQDITDFELSERGASMINNFQTPDLHASRATEKMEDGEELPEVDFSRFNKSISKKNDSANNSVDPKQLRSPLLSCSMPIKRSLDMDRSRFSFDFTDALDCINSPSAFSQDSSRRKSRKSRGSLPFDLQFAEAIQKAVEIHVPEDERVDFSRKDTVEKTVDEEKGKDDDVTGILEGLCVVISKKLAHRQMELHHIAFMLGAQTKFLYDKQCTHFIHQGKLNDNSKDYAEAKRDKKYLVSPCWLEACLESNFRVPEEKYPVNFNPRMSIDVAKTRTTRSKVNSYSEKQCKSGHENEKLQPKKKEQENLIKRKNENETKNAVEKEQSVNTSGNMNLNYQKKMEEIMEATKATKSRKSSRRPLSNSKSDKLDSSGLGSRKRRTRTSSQKSSADSSNLDTVSTKSNLPDNIPGQSQSDCISYDDPAGRLERERILAQLKRASPSQDVEAFHLALGKENQQLRNGTLNPNEELNQKKKSVSPQPPQVSLPITNEIEKPEAINLLSDDEEEKENRLKEENSKKYKFLMSGMTVQEKINYGAIIEQLGGVVFDVQYFSTQCTHVIFNAPSRNEKYLATIASGKWALHKSFLEASRENNAFVNEEDHEWGSQSRSSELEAAAKRWRVELGEKREKEPSVGAFTGWAVLLCIEEARQLGFKRIFEAGGGRVVHISPPFENISGATHAFIGDKKQAQKYAIDYEALHNEGIWILKPEYIPDYLTRNPIPPTFNYLIDEAKSFQDGNISAPAAGKRKMSEATTQRLKRTRRR